MSSPFNDDIPVPSTRPYMIRALHDWCTDAGLTPYLAVAVTSKVRVPMEYVKEGEIVLNVSFDATSGLKLGNEFIEFTARFGGVPRNLVIPVDNVIAIYARENGQGMAFTPPAEEDGAAAEAPKAAGLRLAGADDVPAAPAFEPEASVEPEVSAAPSDSDPQPPVPPAPGGRPALKRVK